MARVLAAASLILFLSSVAHAAPDAVQGGRYLATLGDCEVCHTAPVGGAKPYAGGYPLHAIFGTVYSTNITPDNATGIGKWTPDQFYRALHSGVAADGDHLYPAFPYPYFHTMARPDSDALYAYLRTVKPVYQKPVPDKLIFPTNIRALMTFWDLLFVPQSQFNRDPSRGADWNRGGELVHGLGHCGGCHTPKNIFFSDKSSERLQGAKIDDWYAPDLTGSAQGGLGKWTAQDIEGYLKTGRNRFGRVVGSMRDVISVSTSQWTDGDRHAVAVYLKSLPSSQKSKSAPPKPDADAMQNGQTIFVQRCESCHIADRKDYPALAHNSAVQANNATTIVRVILRGSQSAAVKDRPTGFSMPAFAVLSDKQLADVATFIRNSWGNHAGAVKADTVSDLRKALKGRP